MPKEMERFDADIGSFQSSLQERPEVFDPVHVYLAINVFLCVVDHLMDVLAIKARVGNPCIAENIRTAFDVFAYNAFEVFSRCVFGT